MRPYRNAARTISPTTAPIIARKLVPGPIAISKEESGDFRSAVGAFEAPGTEGEV
jgi:hypothetical protein